MEERKSRGLTPSEQILADLCEQTFLSLWSYPNPFRDQGKTTPAADGKELCDLLVVFGSHVVIFSDKSCAFPDSGHLALDWSRWFERSIRKSADQIYGAERWLRTHPDRVFVDRKCTVPLPFPFPDPRQCTFHRVVVALGATERCRQELGGRGSLRIVPAIRGADHQVKGDRDGRWSVPAGFLPFAVGQVNPERGYVHVLDEHALSTLLRELDSATDFIRYLTEKEKAVLSGRLDHAAGEEELLFRYLSRLDAAGRHTFHLGEGDRVSIEAGSWERWTSGAAYGRERALDQPSREVWDGLIDDFSARFLAGPHPPGTVGSASDMEQCLRLMASESRLARRGLTRSFLERLAASGENERTWRMAFSLENPGTGYVFLYDRREDGADAAEYLETRNAYLSALMLVYAFHNPQLTHVVGIATEAGMDRPRRSYAIRLLVPDRASMDAAETRRLQEMVGMRDEDINAAALVSVRQLPREPGKI